VLHRSRHLHLQLLVHLPPQLVPEEQHREATRAQQQRHHQEVEEGAHYLREYRSRLNYNPAPTLLVQTQLPANCVLQLLLASELQLLMVEDDGGVVSDLGIFCAVEGEPFVDLEIGLIGLLLTRGEEVIDFGVDGGIELQLVHDACRTVVRDQSFGVAFKASLIEPLGVLQIFFGVRFEDEMLANILSH
jgi:hypothetical protein